MSQLAHGWEMDVERGPDWLFVRLRNFQLNDANVSELASSIWSLLRQHFTSRLVLELDELPILYSNIIGQLVLLHKRIHGDGGLLRVSGLSESNLECLRGSKLAGRFPNYRSREDAVLSCWTAHPL